MSPLPVSIMLASASPRRRDILMDAGFRFEICPAQVEEFEDPSADPVAMVHYNAQIKAKSVAVTHMDAGCFSAWFGYNGFSSRAGVE